MVSATSREFGVVVVGGGPAGLAVLLSAHQSGRLSELLQQGLLIVERSRRIGPGLIGQYVINSDSTGTTFVDPLRGGNEPALHDLLESEVARRIAAAGPESVPLRDVGELMDLVGQALRKIIARYPHSAVETGCTGDSAQCLSDGSWELTLRYENGSVRRVRTRRLVLATGATQPRAKLEGDTVAGVPVVQRWGTKLLQSGDVLALGGLDLVAERLRGRTNPTVAILGGSTSAMAVAHALLNRLPQVQFQADAIKLFHRRPLRVYYTSAEEALADGYTEFTSDDLCPITRRVFRLAGLRLDSRELLMQVRGIGGRPPEPRMTMHKLAGDDTAAVRQIDAADLVVAALGYRPNALQIRDTSGRPIALFVDTSRSAPLVDNACRVLDREGAPIAGLFGIGLAAGFVPHGRLGGEPSFRGQANGLWLWQNHIGALIVDAVLEPLLSRRRPAARAKSTTTLYNVLPQEASAVIA